MFLDDKILEEVNGCNILSNEDCMKTCRNVLGMCFEHIISEQERVERTDENLLNLFKRVDSAYNLAVNNGGYILLKEDGFRNYVKTQDGTDGRMDLREIVKRLNW